MNKLWYKKRSSLHGSGLFAATNIKNKDAEQVNTEVVRFKNNEGI